MFLASELNEKNSILKISEIADFRNKMIRLPLWLGVEGIYLQETRKNKKKILQQQRHSYASYKCCAVIFLFSLNFLFAIFHRYCCCYVFFADSLLCYTARCRHLKLWHPSYNFAFTVCSLFRSHYSYDLLCGNRCCFCRFTMEAPQKESICLINELVKINGDFFGATIMSWRQIATISMLFIW